MSEQEPKSENGPAIENPEAVMMEIDALEESSDGDLKLTASFQSAWQAEIADIKESDTQHEEILTVLGLEEGDVEFEQHNDAYKILVDGSLIGVLESEAAFYADLAGARLFVERLDDWEGLDVGDRSRLLKGLRLFLEECPECGNTVTFDTEEVESCCGSHQVAAVECDDCQSRLFESAPLRE